MKRVLSKIIVGPLILFLTMVEWLITLLIKISAVAAGLLINVLLVCIFIAICTRQWVSVGILGFCIAIGMLFVYGQVPMSYIIKEVKEGVKQRK